MKKARYDGPSGTGVEVEVQLTDGQFKTVHVDRGAELAADVGGIPIDPSIVTRLLASADWTNTGSGGDADPAVVLAQGHTVKELRDLAAERGLAAKGSKAELADAIAAHDAALVPEPAAESAQAVEDAQDAPADGGTDEPDEGEQAADTAGDNEKEE